MTDANTIPGTRNRVFYQIKRKDLPLSCPPAGKAAWDQHPRVYLPLKKAGKISCPYCSARYELVD